MWSSQDQVTRVNFSLSIGTQCLSCRVAGLKKVSDVGELISSELLHQLLGQLPLEQTITGAMHALIPALRRWILQDRGQSQLYSESESSLNYMRPFQPIHESVHTHIFYRKNCISMHKSLV